MRKMRARLVLLAAAAALAASFPSAAEPSSAQMNCSDLLEPVCIAIGTACRTLDTVEAKFVKKDLINCQLG